MPQKKRRSVKKAFTTKKARSFRVSLFQNAAWQRVKNFKWGESYTSLLLGVVVVIVTVLFGVSIIRQQAHIQQTSSLSTTSTGAAVSPTPTPSQQPGATVQKDGKTVYIVKEGDDLWSIADHFYHDSYKWTDIAKANNLTDPSSIFSGNELVIPQQQVAAGNDKPAIHEVSAQTPNAITGNSYTVVAGDNLWDIAVRAYADGYRWTDIAKENNLAEPGVIHVGDVLKIPR